MPQVASGEAGGSAGESLPCPVICGTYLTGVYVCARPACPVGQNDRTGVGRNYRTGVCLPALWNACPVECGAYSIGAKPIPLGWLIIYCVCPYWSVAT